MYLSCIVACIVCVAYIGASVVLVVPAHVASVASVASVAWGGYIVDARVCKGCVFVNCTLDVVAHGGCALVFVAYGIFVGKDGLVVDGIPSVGI